ESFELKQAGFTEKNLEQFNLQKQEIDPDQELKKMQDLNIKAITINSEKYPQILKQIFSPPFILYYQGNIELLNSQCLATVGSRKITAYGQIACRQILEPLTKQDLTIVSGLALGVDALAHSICLENNSPTIAVLGSGLDPKNLYPATNRALAKGIVEKNGLLLSEFPLGTMPLKYNFPRRNRIISGLSQGVLVVEAAESSGALITAKFALEQNREIFAIPGQINHPLSEGTNKLIQNGAKLVQTAEDILEELNIKQLKSFQKNRQTIPDSAEEATILKHLENEPLHINEIIKRSGLTAKEVNSCLIVLEMKGLVKDTGNNNYMIVK
ncbi:MAG TPA: DNA-processing protein DprA, partial [Patescibacteria group bacterium]|nr:DNA-processing protein DprA [Patescibacteria group bacterium]